MIKELWILVKLLFSSSPSDIKELELLEMKHFPFSGYKFMSWCGRMIYRESNKDRIQREIGTSKFETSKIHETIHLRQAQVEGSWVKYYLKYFWEWLKGNPIISPASSAYKTIPYEIQAYANEDNPDYINNFPADDLSRYTLKNRKKVYREHRDEWRKFIKSL